MTADSWLEFKQTSDTTFSQESEETLRKIERDEDYG